MWWIVFDDGGWIEPPAQSMDGLPEWATNGGDPVVWVEMLREMGEACHVVHSPPPGWRHLGTMTEQFEAILRRMATPPTGS